MLLLWRLFWWFLGVFVLIPVFAKLLGLQDRTLPLFDPQAHPLVSLAFILDDQFVQGMYAPELDRFFTLDGDPPRLREFPPESPEHAAVQEVLYAPQPRRLAPTVVVYSGPAPAAQDALVPGQGRVARQPSVIVKSHHFNRRAGAATPTQGDVLDKD